MRRLRLIALTSLLLAGAAVSVAQPQPSRPTAPASQIDALPDRPAPTRRAGQPRFGSFGVDLAARNVATKAGDDFYAHANGAWLDAVTIPADRTGWSLWTSLSVDIDQQLRTIMEEAGRRSDPTSRQVANLYASFMDEAGIERRGAAVLRPYLTRIEAARSRDDLIRLFGEPGMPSPFIAGILPSPMDPTRYIALVAQGGLGMPSRNYYLDAGEQFDRYRAGYRTYVTTLLRLGGFSNPEQRADRIIALERKIAEAHWTPEQSRDVMRMIDPKSPAQLAAYAPQFNWSLLLTGMRLNTMPTIIVGNNTAVQKQAQIFAETPVDTWKDWTAFHFISSRTPFLPRAFDQASFEFNGRTLGGQQQQQPRWKRGLGVVNGALGEAVGKLYVDRHFPAASRRQMDELIVNLRAALRERLERNQWMDDATRTEALAKLAAFDPRIGGPVRYIDYGALRIDRNDLIGNMQRAARFGYDLQLSRLPNPVDRSLWEMTPQTINAYYNPLANQITFPAGILQPPFFDPNADPAVNYGAIGAVIGHEIGHGFDDQGRRFDGTGRLRDWWTPAAAERFGERTTRLGAQYAQYEPLPGEKLNPQLTMGENIGDLGGLEMAYAAYRRHVAQHGEPPVIDGLTGDQRFFLAWAQVWRSKQRDDTTRARILGDTHSFDKFRVNGVVRNMDAWYRAFNVQPGDRMYLPPDQRVSIW